MNREPILNSKNISKSKQVLHLLLLVVFFLNSQVSYSQYNQLVWSDEFNGTSVDQTKWNFVTGNGCPNLCGWGNGELENYTDGSNNATVANGVLTMTVKHETSNGSPFTSSKLVTLGKFSKTYGRFEARMRMPKGVGMWPAFWMLSTKNDWPMTGEIDIMEYRGDQPKVDFGTLHYGLAWPNNRYDGNSITSSTDLDQDFHIYAVEWTADDIKWYLDNTLYKTETRNPNSLNPVNNNTSNLWPWNNDFYIILNFAVGGGFCGSPSESQIQLTKPTFEIDYVRVYDKTTFTKPEPYNANRLVIPGVIEAEEYDKGGQALAYNDNDAGNTGTKFRNDDVDIESCSDLAGGYDVGWMNSGEWLNYSVNVKESGNYSFQFRAASLNGGGSIHIEVDGVNIGSTTISSTGGWQIWANSVLKNIALTSGNHNLKIFVDASGFNLNSFAVVKESTQTPNIGFLHASGKTIVNNNGNYIIRAINMGNWMVQEPYMMQMTGFAGTQHEIKSFIEGIIGVTKTQQWYDAWLQNSVQKSDIDSIASWGFNTVRLPMHYNLFTLPIEQEPDSAKQTWLDKGFALTDSIIAWCTANHIYVILDLHAAPGGQGREASISDYDVSKPSLWENQRNVNKTIALWKMLAARYAHNPWVGGLDLINETCWSFSTPNKGWDETENIPLMKLMTDLTSVIRQVDQKHILFVEGNSFANNYSGLTPKWDDNMAYSFHKYWNSNDVSSLNFIFQIRDWQNVPIWLGETGENSNFWFTKFRELMESNNIGWSFWPLKKIGSLNSPFSVKLTAGYQTILNYGNGTAMKPNSDSAFVALMDLTEKLKTQNLDYNKDVTDALFRQFGNTQTKPWTTLTVPGTINAREYDMGLQGFSYNDNDYQNTNGGSWNNGWIGRNDGVDLQWSNTEKAYTMGWTNAGEWVAYTINANQSEKCQFRIRYATQSSFNDTIDLSLDGTIFYSFIVTPTGGWDIWQNSAYSSSTTIPSGSHILKVVFRNGNVNLSSIQSVFAPKTEIIPLQKGWNLISTNLIPTDSSIATLFNGLDVQEIKTMNAFWRKNQNPNFNSLNFIQSGNGYLVYMNATATLTIIGTPIVIRNSQFVIVNGWQLLGCPYQNATAISNDFNISNSTLVKNFDGFWIPNGSVNSLQNLEPGKAYFLRK
jgi:beta-glucanase (GH16 family)/aryl-phospho-beta-D-glucosidase BglC (GH1 family)